MLLAAHVLAVVQALGRDLTVRVFSRSVIVSRPLLESTGREGSDNFAPTRVAGSNWLALSRGYGMHDAAR